MSVVPSINASSTSVLPGIFGSPAAKSGDQKTLTKPAPVESHVFSDVLEQSTDSSGGLASNQTIDDDPSPLQETQQSDSKLQRLVERVPVDEQELADLTANEVLPLASWIAALPIATEVPQANRLPTASNADGSEVEDSALAGLVTTETIVDGSDIIAVPISVTQQQKLPSSKPLRDNVELDPADASLDQPDQDRGGTHRDVANIGALPAESTIAKPNANDAEAAILLRESEAVQQLRTSLETELGVRPERMRPAGNRTTNLRHVLQSDSPNSQVVQSNRQFGQTAETPSGADLAIKAPVAVAANGSSPQLSMLQATVSIDQPVDLAARIDPVSESSKQSSSASLLPKDVASQTSVEMKPTDGQRPPMIADIQQQESVSLTQENVRPAPTSTDDELSQLSSTQPTVTRSDSDSAVADSEQIDSDLGLKSSVNAAVARTGRGNSEADNEESQVALASIDGIETPSRKVSQGSVVDRTAAVAQTLFGGPAVADTKAYSANQLNTVANPESMPASLAVDDTPTESVPDVMPVIDSDLELLQQLLPRDMPVVFGQATDSGVSGQAQSLELPRQIAARAMGEAEVLETGESTRFRMKLDPPELGSVLVDMQKTAQGTTITVTAADPATQQLLQDSLQQLSQADSDEPSVFDHLKFDLSNGDQGDGQESDSRRSQAEKIRIARDESSEADSESASQTSTELDFVA